MRDGPSFLGAMLLAAGLMSLLGSACGKRTTDGSTTDHSSTGDHDTSGSVPLDFMSNETEAGT